MSGIDGFEALVVLAVGGEVLRSEDGRMLAFTDIGSAATHAESMRTGDGPEIVLVVFPIGEPYEMRRGRLGGYIGVRSDLGMLSPLRFARSSVRPAPGGGFPGGDPTVRGRS